MPETLSKEELKDYKNDAKHQWIDNLIKICAAKVGGRVYDIHAGASTQSPLYAPDRDLSRISNIVFKFKTDSSRNELLGLVQKSIVETGRRVTLYLPHKLSTVGCLSYTEENKELGISITFYIIVKYKNARAFRNLKFTNNLIGERMKVMNKEGDYANRKPDTSYEHYILNKINTALYELGHHHSVTLKIANQEFKNFIGFIPGKTGSHADFVGLDMKCKEVCYISHKQGSNASNFQQYSGITSRAGRIADHEEVVNFKDEITEAKQESDFNGMAYYRPIEDPNLKGMAVFGGDYALKKEGMDNVTFFCQGDVTLSKGGGPKHKPIDESTIWLKFHKYSLPQTSLPWLDSRGYKPTLGARKGEGSRKIEGAGGTLIGIRGGVYTESYIVEDRQSEEFPPPKPNEVL